LKGGRRKKCDKGGVTTKGGSKGTVRRAPKCMQLKKTPTWEKKMENNTLSTGSLIRLRWKELNDLQDHGVGQIRRTRQSQELALKRGVQEIGRETITEPSEGNGGKDMVGNRGGGKTKRKGVKRMLGFLDKLLWVLGSKKNPSQTKSKSEKKGGKV